MPALSDQVTVGRLTLRNRLVGTAHGTGLVRDGRGLPGDGDYWRRVAGGGIAMAIIGGTTVAPESGWRSGLVLEAYREDTIPDLRARATAIQAGGAVAVQQLVHLGRETLGVPSWYAPVGPSPVRSPREPVGPRELTSDEVEDVIRAFVRSSAHVAEAGFDGVELHAAHGYLLAQFLSPEANTRTDGYGGDRARRVRIVAEILDGIRALGTQLALGMRLSVEPGLDVAELAAIVTLLGKTTELDWLNITVGPRGEYVRDMGTEYPPLLGSFGPFRSATSLPLVASHSFRTREEIETALAEGADLVGIARPLIADPDFPRKLLEERYAEIRPCVSCNEDCRLFDPMLLCTVNPDLALPGERRRRAQPLLVRAGAITDGGPVAIVGAGPAGLECALTLARAGRADVNLYESDDRLGGALATATLAPFRTGWSRILDFYAAMLADGLVEVLLETRASAEDLSGADEIVLASGSEEMLPELPGSERAVTVTELLRRGEAALRDVERLVVVDDGFGWWPGVSAVELAAAAGIRDLAVLTPGGAFATGIPAESRIQLWPRLAGTPLRTVSFLVPLAVEAEGLAVRHRLSGATELVPADLVVFVGERRPVQPAAVRDGARVQAIGDAVVPRRVAHAIAEGRAAAEAILERSGGEARPRAGVTGARDPAVEAKDAR
jgi:2,4-dienoyl-CoA reductase-like NADH-dependent reductase (Old Yellow Enzyme family)